MEIRPLNAIARTARDRALLLVESYFHANFVQSSGFGRARSAVGCKLESREQGVDGLLAR